MARTTGSLIVVAIVVAACGSGTAVQPAFKTTHVTLYDCGLAQIEKQADVVGASELEIDVEVAHLDDLLASLVLATDGSVKVKGVKFPGVQNLGQAVASSGFSNSMVEGSGSLEMPADLLGYARALVGTSVVLTGADGKKVKGTVLDAVDMSHEVVEGEQNGSQPAPLLVLVTPVGAIKWIPFDTHTEVVPTSQLEAASIKNFATALGKANGLAETTIVLETTPDSQGKLGASYIRQIPLWRILYKMTVEEDHLTMESWAVVHNDTSEDWDDVDMTLVSGLPEAYVFSVSSPRYVYRDVTEAPGEVGDLMPQLGANTPDTLLYDWDIYHSGYGGLGMIGYGSGGGGTGVGYGSGSGYLSGKGGYSSHEKSSSLIKVGEAAAEEQVVAEVEGEISTYTAMSAVSLPSGGTGLVPLIRRELEGQAFTLLTSGDEPSTCLRMVNGTGLVLQPGMVSFYLDGRFRGQDEIWRTEPGDIRVLCYGGDPDITFGRLVDVEHRNTALEWKHETLWVHSLRKTTMDYTVENWAGQPRQVAIDITHLANGRVLSPTDLLDTDSETRKLFLLTVPGRSDVEQRIVVEEGVMSSVPLLVSRFDKMLEAGTLSDEEEAVLEAARKILVEKESLEDDNEERRAQIGKHQETITWQKDLLEKVPQMAGKSAAVDKILTEIMKLQKQIRSIEDEIEKTDLKIADIEKKAKAALEALEPEPPSG